MPRRPTSRRTRVGAGRAGPSGGRGTAAGGTHLEHEDHPWTINVGDHAKRTDSPAFVLARRIMHEITPATTWYYGPGPYQDHHGASLWVKDEQGWFLLKNLAGIEWSAQFCADPAKVDALRLNAKRLYDKFPLTTAAFTELGFDLVTLLTTPITDSKGVANWTDSICNAGVPLAAPVHTGVLASPSAPKGVPQFGAAAGAARDLSPSGKGPARRRAPSPPRAGAVVAGGVHHYPTPITDIQFFKHSDFTLWVTDQEGYPAAVVPAKPREQKDRSAEVLYATPGSTLHKQLLARHVKGKRLILKADHPLAKKAFAISRRLSGAGRKP